MSEDSRALNLLIFINNTTMRHFTQFIGPLPKKQLLRLFVVMAWGCWGGMPALAQEFVVDSMVYVVHPFVLEEGAEETTPCAVLKTVLSDPEHLVVPDTVSYEGTKYPVAQIGLFSRYSTDAPLYKHLSLRSVTLPSTIRCISPFAFSGCENLQAIQFGTYSDAKRRLRIYDAIFEGCNQLTSMDFPGYTEFCSEYSSMGILYGSGVKQIRIPGTCSFSEDARNNGKYGYFQECRTLETVILEEGITEIPPRCFLGCNQLRSVQQPESLVRVGMDAFGGFYANAPTYSPPFLRNQPDGIIYIGKTAYLYKGNVPTGTEIQIRPGTRVLGFDLYYEREKLKDAQLHIPNTVNCIEGKITPNMVFEEGNPNYMLRDGVLYGDSGRTLLKAMNLTVEDFTVPSTVDTIYGEAFSACTSLRSLTIPETITGQISYVDVPGVSDNERERLSLGLGGICEGCTSLERVILRSSGLLSNNMFKGCSSLKEVVIDGNYITDEDTVFVNGRNSIKTPFVNCPALESLTFTDKVDYIGALCAEKDSLSLTALRLPQNVKWLGDYAFRNFKRLKAVALPRMEQCGRNVFANCTGLEQVDLSRMTDSIPTGMFADCSRLSAIQLPKQITAVKSEAFQGCTRLNDINLENIKEIGDFGFAYCTNLKKVEVPALEKIGIYPMEGSGYSRTGGVYYLGTTVCGYDTSLPDSVDITIDIREGTTEILPYAFNPAPASDRDVRRFAFPIRIPASVHTIGSYAFAGRSVSRGEMASFFTLPPAVKHIGDGAFYSFQLTDTLVVLPASLDSIGRDAFTFGGSALMMYVQSAIPCKVNSSSFRFPVLLKRNARLYVPTGSKEAYEDSPWSRIFRNIEEYDVLPTAIHTSVADNDRLDIRITDKGIAVNTAVRVYTTEGRLVAVTRQAGTVALPKGRIYVVRGKESAVKVFVP